MPDYSLLNINSAISELAFATQSKQELRKVFFFHDVRIVCQTNHPRILSILEKMLGTFPEPETLRGEVCYGIYCYDNASQFPLQLPAMRTRTETLRLLTNTRLKCYKAEGETEYHSYEEQAGVNAPALSIIYRAQQRAVTELESLSLYQETFLHRYVFLIVLGQLMREFGFEPCHSAAITAPWDSSQGALIMGHSGRGKTTLSLGCAMSGCGLLGDDLTMLRADEQTQKIAAYSIFQEVSVRSGSLDLWPSLDFLRSYPVDARDKRYCLIERLRPGIKRTKAPIDILIFPSLTDEASSTLTPLSKARTLQTLIDLCTSKSDTRMSYLRTQEHLFFLLSDLAQQARGYQLAIARGASDGPQLVRALFTGNPHE